MVPSTQDRPSSFLSRVIFALVTAQLGAGIAVEIYRVLGNDPTILRLYFDYEGALVLLLFRSLQLFLAFVVFHEFSSDRPLSLAWLYIVAASVCSFLGTVLKHFLAVNTSLNPLPLLAHGNTSAAKVLIEKAGMVIGGPLQMVLLGIGLCLALKLFRQLGILAKLRGIDLVLIGAAILYAVFVVASAFKAVQSEPAILGAENMLAWLGDCVLSVLLVAAVFLHRSARDAGGGYLGRVWTAFAIGIFLSTFCSFAVWITTPSILGWGIRAFVPYFRYASAAAFALAPAYQWEAMRTARKRIRRRASEVGLTAPVSPNAG